VSGVHRGIELSAKTRNPNPLHLEFGGSYRTYLNTVMNTFAVAIFLATEVMCHGVNSEKT